MKSSRIAILLSVAAGALAASTLVRAADLGEGYVDETPQRWFVELSNAPTSDGGNASTVANDHANFKSQAAAAGLRSGDPRDHRAEHVLGREYGASGSRAETLSRGGRARCA